MLDVHCIKDHRKLTLSKENNTPQVRETLLINDYVSTDSYQEKENVMTTSSVELLVYRVDHVILISNQVSLKSCEILIAQTYFGYSGIKQRV